VSGVAVPAWYEPRVNGVLDLGLVLISVRGLDPDGPPTWQATPAREL
jgi:hypothetical protein